MIQKSVKREAEQFGRPGRAYIHSEWIAGNPVETIIAGDIQGQHYLLACIVQRMAELYCSKFDDVIDDVKSVRPSHSMEVLKLGQEQTDRSVLDVIQKAAEESAEKKYRQRVQAAEAENARLRYEIESNAATLKSMQAKIDKIKSLWTADNVEHDRAIRAYESEIRKYMKLAEEYSTNER